MKDNAEYDMTIPPPSAFGDYMGAKYGGIIVAPKGGFQTDDLHEAFLAGWEAAVLEHC